MSDTGNPPNRPTRRPPRDASEQTELALSGSNKRGEGDEPQVSGIIERVTYHDEESGFGVVRIRPEQGRQLVTVVGRAPQLVAGEFVSARGSWHTDPRHGRQFKADELRVSAPSTRKGMERFLGSGLVQGIGPGLAKRLVEHFGDRVFDVIEHQPEKLREVEGLGEIRVKRIAGAWKEQQRVREIMLFLYSHGLGTARAVRIHRTYGADAVERIRSDPYCLARDIRGIGFPSADALAKQLGVEDTATSRIRAGLAHVLHGAVLDGHCGLPESELLTRTGELLGLSSQEVAETLEAEVASQELMRTPVRETPCIFVARLFRAEKNAAAGLLALAAGAPSWSDIDTPKAIARVEASLGHALAPSQREALDRLQKTRVGVLTGGPGVGKTTLVKAFLGILSDRDLRIALAAPTGRAAKRLSEATGLEASTLHRLLEADPRSGSFKRDARNPLECDLLVIDEASMIDVPLLASCVAALPPGCALLLIGDVDQLPSVGPGRVLADIIDSGAFEVVRLREIFRQAAASRIVQSAHCVNEGRMPELEPDGESDFYFIESRDPEDAVAKLLTVIRERIPARFGLDPIRDVQVLCPMHRGRLGTRSLNEELQQALNPKGRELASVERFGWTYSLGDKVMQIENDYDKDVYNGDVGTITKIDIEAQTLAVEFDGSRVDYDFDGLDSLMLAYATTVHKAQGSEYPAVVIPLVTQHFMMLKRNLVYTGLTRGKRLVVLIGERKALRIALEESGQTPRWSKLRDWLAEGAVAN